ncbi:hypothetical protein [Stieleria mannarensis]|uniref:hypothetical protein n=1 Tax=Stieleria mannarensis TaxID=2755585 RepID=UPI0015FFB423|nr:hypothetical protein [Rhodopirellula sp. JC639]
MFNPPNITQGVEMLRKFTNVALACAFSVALIGCDSAQDSTDTDEAVEVVVEETEEATEDAAESVEETAEEAEEAAEDAAEAVEEEAAE